MSRKRYRWNASKGELEELGADYVPESRQAGAPVSDLYMDGVRATDGTDIGSRKKRREYMQARGLADADDFRGEWARAQKAREAAYVGGSGFDSSHRREAVARALYDARKARR